MHTLIAKPLMFLSALIVVCVQSCLGSDLAVGTQAQCILYMIGIHLSREKSKHPIIVGPREYNSRIIGALDQAIANSIGCFDQCPVTRLIVC